jgi:hypothetical protein
MSTAAMVNVFLWLGLIVSGLLLCAGYYLLGMLGAATYGRLRRVYQLSVISYWLQRLEREGVRCFPKARDKAADAAIAKATGDSQ